MAIDIGRMFEATKDGKQVMSGEDPKVEVNKLAWKNGSSKKNGSFKKKNEKVQKCDRCGYNAHKPQELKDMCCEAPVLAHCDVRKDVTIQCDANKSAVGAVLLQEGRPIAYASELNWAPIEKKMLAIVFSTRKFREYILGKNSSGPD